MELSVINRTLLIELYRYHKQNDMGDINIFIDSDTMSIFKAGLDKPITRVLKVNLSPEVISETHFGSVEFSYIAQYKDNAPVSVRVPYSAMVGYELHGHVHATPSVCALPADTLEALYNVMVESAMTLTDQVEFKPKGGTVVMFPRPYKKRDPELNIQ